MQVSQVLPFYSVSVICKDTEIDYVWCYDIQISQNQYKWSNMLQLGESLGTVSSSARLAVGSL